MIAYAYGICSKKEYKDDSEICISAYYSELDVVNYGILSGPAFALSLAFFGIFGGVVADRVNRRFIIALSCLLWSLMTALAGLVDSFALLYITRFLTGIFMAFFNPACYSIISDIFHPQLRTTANAVFNLGIYFGGGLASMSTAMIIALGW